MTKTEQVYQKIKKINSSFDEFTNCTLLEIKMRLRAMHYGVYSGRACDLAAEKIYNTIHKKQ